MKDMKKSIYMLPLMATLFVSSCDIEMVPKGQTTLESAQEIEYLLNSLEINVDPGSDLCVIVNESYGQEFTTVKQLIANTNTLTSVYLSYNEGPDRANLTRDDKRYSSIYKAINTLNVALGKIDDSSGEEAVKTRVKAEAHVKRAYLHFIAANIYAKQYDEATASKNGGIAYVTDYEMNVKEQLPLDRVYELILEDLDDEYIDQLPDEATVLRCSKATGNAIKARVLFQMKRYSSALAYAEKALELNDEVEDRSYMMDEYGWYLLPTSPNNYIYISSSGESWWVPFADNLSLETVAKFEDGDFTIDYGYSGYPEEGEELWNPMYGEMNTGIEGSLSFSGYDTYKNPWGLTVEQMMYIAAECHIRSGEAGGVQTGMDLINLVRTYRIDPDKYEVWSASDEREAMAYLQRAKFIENIATAENFFDRKRWNTEDDYKMTITRELPGIGTYSISPESPLWVLPFPNSVIQNNPTFTQNY